MEKIDFVVTWVDGGDPAWLAEKNRYRGVQATQKSDNNARYRDWGILRYWFRAVEKYAPWVNRIYFVTWGHLPEWLDTENEKLVIVNHRDYIPEEYLPTFSSIPIELNVHRIPGLSEKFVYFDDDMFLNAPVEPEDFFKDGKPRDAFGLDAILFAPSSVGHIVGNNVEIINKYFSPRKQLRKLKLRQCFHPAYGPKMLYRTLVLSIWPWFTGIYCDHLMGCFLKSTFEEVWEKERDVLHRTCQHRFRTNEDVSEWLFRFWQMVTGNFEPRSGRFGKAFHLTGEIAPELRKALSEEKYRVVCVNDSELTDNVERQQAELEQLFRKKYPEKSSFEK